MRKNWKLSIPGESTVPSYPIRYGDVSYVMCYQVGVCNWVDPTSEQEVRERWWNVQSGETVVDVGAGLGGYVLPSLAMGAEKVWAFEPDEEQADLLEQSLMVNGWSDRATVVRLGCWKHSGEAKLHVGFTDAMIAVTSLDEYLPVETRVDWIKIDVEGFELEVLEGASRILHEFRPNLLIENHLQIDRSLERRTIEWIEALGLLYQHESASLVNAPISHTFFRADDSSG